MSTADDDGFLARWSRRKADVQRGVAVPPEAPAPPAPAMQPVAAPAAPAAPPPPAEPPAPTIDEALALTPASDFRRFVARNVDPAVKNTALKQLFADPHFNLMDGLDVYIDDYGQPSPLPAAMLRQMVQSRFLGLFDEEAKKPEPADEDPDLRLQPDDAAGRAGPGPCAEGDAGGEP